MYKSIVFASNYDNMYCFSTLHGRDAKLDNNYPLKFKASTETFLLELTAYKESAQVNRFQWTP